LLRGRVHVPTPRVAVYRPSSLRELAMHNAIEGCAREMLGATINLWQAQRARDREIRAAFAEIANDECAHAELSWEIHTWAMQQLDAIDAIAIADAQHAALESLCETTAIDAATRHVLGLPSGHELRVLVNAIA
jgi:rubrerythrin